MDYTYSGRPAFTVLLLLVFTTVLLMQEGVCGADVDDVLQLNNESGNLLDGSSFSSQLLYLTAAKDIRNSLDLSPQPNDTTVGDLCDDGPCCFYETDAAGCSIEEMDDEATTLVFPGRRRRRRFAGVLEEEEEADCCCALGGKTRCMYTNSTSYAFQVSPGDPKNLLLFFQGGGAVWDEISVKLNLAYSNVNRQKTGVFSRTHPMNPYADYTQVLISYCSGDCHGGDSVRNFTDPEGNPVVQAGRYNVESALAWVQAQQAAGNLAQQFDSLVIMGESAGSLGSQLWSTAVLNQFDYNDAYLILDSFVGYFPEGVEEPLIRDYAFCPLLDDYNQTSPELVAKCYRGEMKFREVVAEFITESVTIFNANWGFIQSKEDIVQRAFFDALALTEKPLNDIRIGRSAILDPAFFYQGVLDILGEYATLGGNVAYFRNGDTHTFTGNERFYTAITTTSDVQIGEDEFFQGRNPQFSISNATMLDWTKTPLLLGYEWPTECTGPVSASNTTLEGFETGVEYCYAPLMPLVISA